MMNSVLKLTFATAIVLASGCSSCSSCSGDKKDVAAVDPNALAKKDAHAAMPPPPGSDADQRRVTALALATTTDAELATFKHDEKPMDPGADGHARSAEVWFTDTNGGQPLVPKKLVIKELDGGATKSQTDMYFDDKSMLAYAHAPDGHFVFRMEGLALWLDPDQKIKHGIKPQDAGARSAALKKDMSSALTMFRIR